MHQPTIPLPLRLTLIPTLVLAAGSLRGAEPAPDFAARFVPVPPCSSLVAAARANEIPLDQIDPPTQGSSLDPGDSVTALVTFREKGARLSQWLVHVQVVAPRPDELPDKPSAPMVMYTTAGTKLEFTSSPAMVSLRTLGPFADSNAKRKSPTAGDKSARFGLNQDFLGLGLDKAASIAMRFRKTKPADLKGGFSFGSKPFSEAEVKVGRKLAEAMHISADEERALAGTAPALISYFGIVQRTSGLEDILFKILDMPSLWSIMRRGGISTFFQMRSEHIAPANASAWGLPPAQPVYYVPMVLELNNQPSLNITLVVTAPEPPLLTCGGIVGMLAERPGDQENYLTLRIISARRSASK